MKKALRILTSPIVLALSITGYWLTGFLGICILIGTAAEYISGSEVDREMSIAQMKIAGILIASPILLPWAWIQHPEYLKG